MSTWAKAIQSSFFMGTRRRRICGAMSFPTCRTSTDALHLISSGWETQRRCHKVGPTRTDSLSIESTLTHCSTRWSSMTELRLCSTIGARALDSTGPIGTGTALSVSRTWRQSCSQCPGYRGQRTRGESSKRCAAQSVRKSFLRRMFSSRESSQVPSSETSPMRRRLSIDDRIWK
jgi:hypothetical protein